MSTILIILPQAGFDPTEVAFPWQVWTGAGHTVRFASELGTAAQCDPITLTGSGLPWLARSLRAKDVARLAYRALESDPAFGDPIPWHKAHAKDFSALHFPGGHAPTMRPYCESLEVHRLAREAFAAHLPVSAICHGVLPLARAGVLAGRRTTSLTAPMENLSITLTRHALGNHYRTYPDTVEAEARAAVGARGRYERGPLIPRYADASAPHAGFVVQDLRYLSARWPGDAWTLAERLLDLL